jgi:anti-sigma regulatory factor (Ser/Thr protein kinase)
VDDRRLELPPLPTSPRVAREFVAGVVVGWGLDHLADAARLLTSELVTNAVLHARTSLTVRVDRDEERQVVRVSVLDHSEVRPRRRHYSPMSTTGRGLVMVRGAARDYGVDSAESGKAVWFELPLMDDAAAAARGRDLG